MIRAIGPTHGTRWILIVAVAAPVVVQLLSGVRFSLGPSRASAHPITQPAGLAPIVPTVEHATETQTSALEWIREHADVPAEANPFAVIQPEQHVVTNEEPPQVALPNQADSVPTLKITGFIGKGPSSMVTINRRVRRLGDVVAPGWKLKGIDSTTKSIQIENESGREVAVTASAKDDK